MAQVLLLLQMNHPLNLYILLLGKIPYFAEYLSLVKQYTYSAGITNIIVSFNWSISQLIAFVCEANIHDSQPALDDADVDGRGDAEPTEVDAVADRKLPGVGCEAGHDGGSPAVCDRDADACASG